MDNFFSEEKLTIIEFLQKHEQYKIFEYGGKHKTDTYLFKPTLDGFQIIRINNTYHDDLKDFVVESDVWKRLSVKLLKKQKHLQLKTLVIILGNRAEQSVTLKENTLINLNKEYKNGLAQFFPGIKQFIDDKEVDLKKLSPEELKNQMEDAGSRLNRDLKKISQKFRSSNLIVVWISTVLFIVLPFLLFLFSGSLGFKGITSSTLGLILGGLNRDVVVGLNQWWRLFTYVFATDSIFSLLIYGIILFFSVKLLEVTMKPWKIFIAFICLIPTSAFLTSIAIPGYIFTGPQTIAVAMYGLMFMTHYSRKTLTSQIAGMQSNWIPILLILIPLFSGSYMTYLIYIVAFTAGVVMSYFLDYDYRRLRWSIVPPVLIAFCLIVVPIILFETNVYWAPNNYTVFSMMQQYYNQKFMSKGAITKVLENYYHIPANMIGNYISF